MTTASHPAERPQRDFDRALRAAITGRGLALARIRHHLGQRGVAVGVSTLSYWQNGERVPRSTESRRIVAALEEVLEVPAGALTSLLPHRTDERR